MANFSYFVASDGPHCGGTAWSEYRIRSHSPDSRRTRRYSSVSAALFNKLKKQYLHSNPESTTKDYYYNIILVQ